MFRVLNNFDTTLLAAISATATELPLSAVATAPFCPFLGGADYSRVVASDGLRTEIMRVTGCNGANFTVTRGDEGTTPVAFALGSCVRFVWTQASLADYIAHGSSDCKVVSDTLTVTEEGCGTRIELPACSTSESWRAGNRDYSFDGATHCVSSALVPAGEQLTAGVFPFATVTVNTDGEITGVQQNVLPVFVSSLAVTAPLVSTGGTSPTIGHADSGVTPGTYNSVTVDAKGHITAASNVGGGSFVTAVGAVAPLSSSGGLSPVISHAASGVTPGSYLSVVVNAEGHVTGGTAGVAFVPFLLSYDTNPTILFTGNQTHFYTVPEIASGSWVSSTNTFTVPVSGIYSLFADLISSLGFVRVDRLRSLNAGDVVTFAVSSQTVISNPTVWTGVIVVSVNGTSIISTTGSGSTTNVGSGVTGSGSVIIKREA